MAYRGSDKRGELQQLQYEITNEIARDAPEIARGVFGNNARHPDMSSISNAEVDQLYRAAYERNDRDFLMQEAQRDPQQFLDVTDRLGVPDPPSDMHGQPMGVDPTALQKAVQQNAATPAVPPTVMAPGAVSGPPASVTPPVAAPAALPMPAAPGPVSSANMVSSQPPLPGL